MDEEKQKEREGRIDAIKLSVVKGGKEFYYQKWYSEDSWRRIPKLNYAYCLKYNLPIAIEIQKDTEDRIIYMSYKHEKSEDSRARHRKMDEEFIKIESSQPPKNYIDIIKRTLGKDGKYYYYESLGLLEKAENVYWFRTDESHFNWITQRYRQNAINLQHNERGEIIYMEYRIPKTNYIRSENKNENKGCAMMMLLLFIIFLFCHFF